MSRSALSRPSPARGSGALVLLAALALLAGCSSSTEPVFTRWEGNLLPVLPSTVSGVAAAVTQFGRTQASVLIEEAEVEATYGWRIDSGTCQGSGEIQGGAALYSPLVASPGGTASGDATLAVLFRAGDQFAVRVFRLPAAGGEVVVACGELAEAG